MLGLLIMFAITVAIGAAVYWLTASLWAAVGIAAFMFAGWCLLNVRAGSTGLVKANLFAYFSGRRKGMSHDQAIVNVVNTRYRRSRQHRVVVLTCLDAMRPFDSEEEEIKELVYIIFEHELGAHPSHDWQIKVRSEIERVYKQLA